MSPMKFYQAKMHIPSTLVYLHKLKIAEKLIMQINRKEIRGRHLHWLNTTHGTFIFMVKIIVTIV